jgi:PRTRC genetic system protein E
MLFSNIHALLKRGVTLNLILAAAGDDKIEVTVLPNTEKSTAGMQLVAKTFVATPQELDQEFPAVMAGYASANLSLKDQLEAVQKQAQETAAAAAAAEAAKAEAAKKPASKPSATSKTSGTPATAAKPTLMDDPDEDDVGGDGVGCASGSDSASSPAPADDSQPQLISL